MIELQYLASIFDYLKRGCHLGPEDEPEFSALAGPQFSEYQAYFAAIGFNLIRHEREFFYFEPENPEAVSDTLPRIAVFSYIMIDHASNQGQSIEEFIFGQNFLMTTLPHFSFDRYTALLRQVDVHDLSDLRGVLNRMEQIGWVKVRGVGVDQFRFLRPFHRVFSKCLELSAAGNKRDEKGKAPTVESTQGQTTSDGSKE
jgi:Condensin complex protein MksE